MRTALTLDVDWAPDSSIHKVLDLLNLYGRQATFFLTHKSDAIKRIISSGHSLGVHPNFLARSSHGRTVREVLDTCRHLVENPRFIRTHSLMQSTPLLTEIFRFFNSDLCDVSTLTYGFPFCRTFRHFDSGTGSSHVRLNYNWEDDFALLDPAFDPREVRLIGETNVFNFHPILIDLNCESIDRYQRLKAHLGTTPLFKADSRLIQDLRCHEPGLGTFFENLLASDYFICPLGEML